MKGPKPQGDTAALRAQTADLRSDEKSIESYTRFILDLTEGITQAAGAASDSSTAVLASAAAKGATLVWEKAPAETAAVVTAAAALAADGVDKMSPEERLALVQSYIAAVNTAGSAHQAVLDQEAAEAARQAQEQQQNSSRSNNGSRNTGGGKPGGSNPGGGTNPGGGSNPGGGTNPGGGSGSNWQPLKVNVTSSACSGSGAKVTYGSTLNIPGTNLDTYNTYEIPGYGWGATWTCSYW